MKFVQIFAFTFIVALCGLSLTAQNKNNPYPEFKPISSQTLFVGDDCRITYPENTDNYAVCDYEKLLGYTHQELEKYLKEKELIELFISTSRIDDDYFLDIRYIFNSINGVDNYGSFSKGSPVKLILLNKEKLYLNNLKNVRGKYSEKNQISYLQGSYLLDDYELKQLMKSPIMDIEVSYEYGTEEYAVENINIVLQQLTCLKDKK